MRVCFVKWLALCLHGVVGRRAREAVSLLLSKVLFVMRSGIEGGVIQADMG